MYLILIIYIKITSPDLNWGGLPSNTQQGLIPLLNNMIVLLKSPTKCPVLFPSLSVNYVKTLSVAP